jgi:hypothetical protein
MGDSWKKVPFSCRTGRPASINEASSWADFATAVRLFQERSRDGIGFVFRADDDFCGVDLDACRNPESGKLQPWAQGIVEALSSYTEVSPSGTGVKIFVRGRLPGGQARRKGPIEIYDHGRFFTVTGHHIPGTPSSVEKRDEGLRRLHDQLAAGPDVNADDVEVVAPGADLTDDKVLATARAAKNGCKFSRLMAGDITGYRSQSEADLALAGILVFWVGRNSDRVERLFAQSELAKRGKWAERPDYRKKTIEKAFDRRAVIKNPPSKVGAVSTRTIQDYQECPGNKSTVVHADAHALTLSSADEGLALHLALGLADIDGQSQDSEVMFKLARELLGRLAEKYSVDAFLPIVAAFCERAGQPAEDYWICFQTCFPKVKLAAGEDPTEWALNMARKQPMMTPRHALDEKYALIGSVAHYLADLRKSKPFWFDAQDLARLLNTTQRTINRVIRLLEQDGIIQQVRPYVPHRVSTEFILKGRADQIRNGTSA